MSSDHEAEPKDVLVENGPGDGRLVREAVTEASDFADTPPVITANFETEERVVRNENVETNPSSTKPGSPEECRSAPVQPSESGR